MLVLINFLHRYLAPFLAGASMAGVTVVHDAPVAVLLVLAAAAFAYVSLPIGGRMIRRIAGAEF